jgi:hypothetical protein
MTAVDRCEFFKCFEERIPCGNNYWIMNWGYKYCIRYADPNFVQKFTKSGKKFLKYLNKCLPHALKKLYKSEKKQISCSSISKQAFKAQSQCYQNVESNFCKAFTENKSLFIKVLDKADMFNMDSLAVIKSATNECKPKINLVSLMLSTG